MKRWPLRKAFFWETAPFLRILIPFAAGIWCYVRGLSPEVLFLLPVIVILFISYLALAYNKAPPYYPTLSFAAVTALLFVCGMSVAGFSDIRNDTNWFGHRIGDDITYAARITDEPVEKESSWKVPVAVIYNIAHSHATKTTGRAFVYLYKDHSAMSLHKGDSILLPASWQLIKNAGNPFEFDYAAYCRQNDLYYQQACSANDVRLYATGQPNAASLTDKAHDWCMQQLATYIKDPKTTGLIQAMILGDEVNLDEDLRQSYADTGIIHIIAISGGNVAIFFGIISVLLWWLRHKKHAWVKYAIALPLVWFYVIMAGAAPSAIRAAVMFSLLAAAVILDKRNNSLNQLCATAFLLLCAEPMWLFSLGFQLSFVAVLSLILFYTPVYRWLSPANKLLRLLWGTVAASIAAEVLVAPLVVYYFHTFPLMFVIANAVAYLFMSAVLVMGMLLIAVSYFAGVATILGTAIVCMVTVFDKLVIALQGFSPASFHYLLINDAELLLLYIVITSFAVLLLKKQKPAAFVGAGALCLLLCFFCFDKYIQLSQQKLVVYNISKADHIELITGSNYTVLQTDTTQHRKISYATTPAHIAWQAWVADSTRKNELLTINGKTVLLLNNDISTVGHFHADYLVVNFPGEADPAKLQHIFSPQLIITGNHYSRRQQATYAATAARAGVAIHSVAANGAFVLE